MKVLVLGGGGREHALVTSLLASPAVDEVVAAPGNVGIAEVARCVAMPDLDPRTVADLADVEKPDLVVVGPEDPLVAGVVDVLADRKFLAFGPSGANARVEGSKAYAKEVMARQGVPTAAAQRFDDVDEAMAYLRQIGGPWVVKADGLAAGKGVVVTERRAAAEAAVQAAMLDGRFGASGRTVLVEEFLEGPELTLLVLTDGKEHLALEPARDHKRIDDGDEGPNTGGMGAYSPVPLAPARLVDEVMDLIVEPTLSGLARDTGEPYRGILYAGLCLTEEGPKVIEFNCRWGDPEAQVLLPRLASDAFDLFVASATGALGQSKLIWRDEAAVTIVLTSPGYPDATRTGQVIDGLHNVVERPAISVFHSGTARAGDGSLVTAGGRVVAITALGDDLRDARDRAYAAVEDVTWEGIHFRRDIALDA